MTNPAAQRSDQLLALVGLALYVPAVGRYGLKLLLLLALSVALGAAIEWTVAALRRQHQRLWGYPAWILFPLVLPPAFPLWMSLAAITFAVLITVCFFGGHGRQVASPVAVCHAFALLSFPAAYGFGWVYPLPTLARGWSRYCASLPTVDHPLVLLAARDDVSASMLLTGVFPQSPAMALPLLLIALGLFLLVFRAISWRATLSFLAIYCLLSYAMPGRGANTFLHMLFAGNALFVVFLLLGDPRVCARTRLGRLITGVAAGTAAFFIRTTSSFPDGAFFAILLANIFAPLFDELVIRRRSHSIPEEPSENQESDEEGQPSTAEEPVS